MRNKTEQFISSIADKSHKFFRSESDECVLCRKKIGLTTDSEQCPKNPGRCILIGDVLKTRDSDFWMQPEMVGVSRLDKLYFYWSECGTDKSLQEIIEKSGWEKSWFCGWCKTEEDPKWGCVKCQRQGGDGKLNAKEILKCPRARALAEFILSLNLKTS